MQTPKFIALNIFCLCAAIAACGPVSPSVSKLSNAAVEKTSTDGSHDFATDSVTPTNELASALIDENSLSQTEPTTRAGFDETWKNTSVKDYFFEMNAAHVGKFKTKGEVSFDLGSYSVSKNAIELSHSKKPKVYLIFSNGTAISKLNLDRVKTSLIWKGPTLTDWDGGFRLKIVFPSLKEKDPISGVSAEKVRANMRDRLESVAIDFDAS